MEAGLGLAAGRELGGRYRLEAVIGRGGMGQVWRAVDVRLRRPVAVKVLPAEIAVAEGGLARFEREAETTAALQHPGITVLFDIGREGDGLTYLVMELLEGEDLRAVIDRHPDGLPVDRAVEFAAQIADALAAAHSRGVVHRDIKPANLFVLDRDRLKLCDFGIAALSAATTRLTRDGSAVGTPRYMAPEQFRGEPADLRSDLYALGCVLHELLTGRTPFTAEAGLPALLYAHLNEPPPSARSRRPEVPDHLDRLVLALLAKPLDERPPDADTVAAYLREAAPAPLPLPLSMLPPIRVARPDGPPTPPPARPSARVPSMTPLPSPMATPPPYAAVSAPHAMTPPPHLATLPQALSARGPLTGRALAAVGAALAVAVAACVVAVFAVTGGLPGQGATGERSERPSASAPAAAPPASTAPANRKITYALTGGAAKVSLMYVHPEGGTVNQQVELPWSKDFGTPKIGVLIVSGSTGMAGGTVHCRITVDGEVVQERSAEGEFAFASCQYSSYAQPPS